MTQRLVRRHELGRTGLMVSEISLGTAEIGMDYGIGNAHRPDEAEAHRLLHGALDRGINFLDTARAYGESEAIIGRALAARRREFVLVSKVQVGSPAEMRASVERSLKLLRTDWLDVLMLHSAPAPVIADESVRTVLTQLREQGLIRFTGVSVYGNEAALAAIDSGFYHCVQIAFSALDRRPEAIAATALEKGVGLIARSVLLKGALTDRSKALAGSMPPLEDAIGRLRELAAAAGLSLPELAYRYVLGAGVVQSALVGASSLNEATQAIAFADSGPLPSGLAGHIKAMPAIDEFYLNPGNWPI